MTPDAIIEALAIPDTARVDQRITKKLLIEQGAQTAADKRAIQDGVTELMWVAALKPTNIGVPVWKDGTGEYLEIAVITASLREGGKAARLTELIHRAVPYPVLLIAEDGKRAEMSLAHKRASQSEKAAVVLDGPLVPAPLGTGGDALEAAFMASLSIASQPQQHLRALYQGWIDCCAGLAASRLSAEKEFGSRHSVLRLPFVSTPEHVARSFCAASLVACREGTTQVRPPRHRVD